MAGGLSERDVDLGRVGTSTNENDRAGAGENSAVEVQKAANEVGVGGDGSVVGEVTSDVQGGPRPGGDVYNCIVGEVVERAGAGASRAANVDDAGTGAIERCL